MSDLWVDEESFIRYLRLELESMEKEVDWLAHLLSLDSEKMSDEDRKGRETLIHDHLEILKEFGGWIAEQVAEFEEVLRQREREGS